MRNLLRNKLEKEILEMSILEINEKTRLSPLTNLYIISKDSVYPSFDFYERGINENSVGFFKLKEVYVEIYKELLVVTLHFSQVRKLKRFLTITEKIKNIIKENSPLTESKEVPKIIVKEILKDVEDIREKMMLDEELDDDLKKRLEKETPDFVVEHYLKEAYTYVYYLDPTPIVFVR